MNIKSTIIASTFMASSAFATPALAQDNSIHKLLGGMIQQAIESASNEVELQIDKAIITSGNMLSLSSEVTKGTVTITDVEAESQSKLPNKQVQKPSENNE